MKKVSAFLALFMLIAFSAAAQIFTPVKWSTSLKMDADGTHGSVIMTAKMDAGWHIYAMDIDPNAGPTPLSIELTPKGAKLDGRIKASKNPERHFDNNFEAELAWWEGSVTFTQKFTATAEKFTIDGKIRYASCNDEMCTPPAKEEFSLNGTAKLAAEETAEEAPAEEAADTAAVAAAVVDSLGQNAAVDGAVLDTWAPVAFGDVENDAVVNDSSLWYIFLMCFVGGFVALLTPCVWPMIPLTVSFFLKRGKSKAKSIADAITYGLSIIIIYVLLGLVITVIFGADALNKLATSATCNIIFFLLLVVFAISFFGAFDIKLPEKWGNKMDAKAEKTTGLLSIFFMAFTLALVSFSCTGPIIGTLLVEAASTGDAMGPAVGMFGFALALAIPFCLFALFPSWLKSAPRSGSWMTTVKVVLGFIELALSLKFLSVADLAYGWHILDRETFLALWIVIFGLLGVYLMGWFTFKGYGEANGEIGTFRFFLALITLSFTIYLIPGLWGAPLKSVSAFVPPLYTQDLNLYGRAFEEFDDYDKALAASERDGKPVFVDFSGYGCVNCRKMEGAVLDNESVHSMITDNFIVVTLMTDDRAPLPAPEKVVENGKTITLETYGEKWSYLQRSKFGANAQPYYVILNSKGQLLSGPFVYDENIPKFTKFLEEGINKAKQ
ncbi:MAG: thioredoxin family protein [Muribaculaceae bacterium]|nr:thioredoxin family protein [Muribaculaceae bacterium]